MVKDAAAIAETLPETYRGKCFEIILTYLLSGSIPILRPQAPPLPESEQKPVIRIEVKALLRQYSVPEDIILNNFFVEGKVVPTYTVRKEKDTKKSRTQIMYALLIALENALKTGAFSFSMDEVKTRLKSGNEYDAANFKANFNNSKGLFTTLTEDNVELSSDGKAELADILQGLKK